jgi:hypothetical protein
MYNKSAGPQRLASPLPSPNSQLATYFSHPHVCPFLASIKQKFAVHLPSWAKAFPHCFLCLRLEWRKGFEELEDEGRVMVNLRTEADRVKVRLKGRRKRRGGRTVGER